MYADKKFFRKKCLAQRKELSSQDLSESSLRITERLKELPLWEKDLYHIFLPILHQNEINTFPILEYLKERSKKIALSKTDFSTGTMNFFLWNPQMDLYENAYGIFEPVGGAPIDPLSIQVAFVPLLAFDARGHRLGYGKGFYDRFLASCSQSIYKIGLSLFGPLARPLAVHAGDIPLDVVVTPDKAYFF